MTFYVGLVVQLNVNYFLEREKWVILKPVAGINLMGW